MPDAREHDPATSRPWDTMMITMERIGRYRLVRRLGAGSFATVWLGRDDDLDVDVAVKILAENWTVNDDVRNRFLAEARLMRRIRDDRIVRVYDIGTLPDSRPYFVMDYCDAGSLADLRRSPGDPIQTLRLCAEACRALDVLHRHQVVHRDVTPGNLLLDSMPDGSVRVLLADLGVAKEMIGQQGMTMTAGTPAFMAPEQATGQPLDPRADIYAMACVTYAVLTGRPPFQVRNVQEVIARHPEEQPVPIAARLAAPPHLDGLLQAALSPDPHRRPPTAEVMATALDQIADSMPVASVAEQAITTRVRPRPAVPGVPLAAPVSSPSPGTPLPAPAAVAMAQPQPLMSHPSGIEPAAMHGPLLTATAAPVADRAPGWQFWTLIGLCGLFVFLGVLFLTLLILS